MAQTPRDERAYIATRSVRHIGVVIGVHWMSLCAPGPTFIPGETTVLFGSTLLPGPPRGHWRLPVCKRCIAVAKIVYSAAADMPSRS